MFITLSSNLTPPISATTSASAVPAAPAARFACAPHPDGTRVQAFLFCADGDRPLTTDAVETVSAEARAALLDRCESAAAAAGHAFDRGAAEPDLIAQAAAVAPLPAVGFAVWRAGPV